MAVDRMQHEVPEIAQLQIDRGVEARFAIQPVPRRNTRNSRYLRKYRRRAYLISDLCA